MADATADLRKSMAGAVPGERSVAARLLASCGCGDRGSWVADHGRSRLEAGDGGEDPDRGKSRC